MAAALHLALARLRHRPARWLLISLGITIAVLLPVMSAATTQTTTVKALRHGIEQLPVGQRSLIVSWSGLRLGPEELARTDAATRSGLAELTDAPIRRQLLFSRLADQAGADFFIGAADGLASAVTVTEGRLPSRCTPAECEVIAIGNGTPALDPALGVRIVGRGVRTDPLLLSGTLDPGRDTPLLLADGVADAGDLTSLGFFQRAYGWSAAIDLDRVSADVPGYLAASSRVAGRLARTQQGLFLTAPDDVLDGAQDRAERSTRRFGLLGGAATALLLGFSVIGAIGGRRDHQETARLMRRRGAPRRHRAVVTGVAACVPVAVGVASGLAGGAAIGGATAARAALPVVALLAIVAVALVAATLTWSAESRGAWRAVDATIVAGIAVAALALARGSITAESVARGEDPLLVALPVLIVGCGGLLVGRLWPPATRALLRIVPRRPLGLRLGLSSVVRRPLRPVATAAFVAAAIGIVIFADGYRSTLDHGASAQAAHAVPLDARLATGPTLRRPLDAAALSDYAALGTPHRVLRASSGVRVNAAESQAAEVIGVDRAAFTEVAEWQSVTGDTDPAGLARALAAPRVLPGEAVPAGAREIAFAASGDVDQIALVAWLRDGDGKDVGVPMRRVAGHFTGTLPAGLAATTLFAFAITEDPDYATHHQHHLGEGGGEVANIVGRVALGPPMVDGSPATAWTAFTDATTLPLEYQLTGAKIVITAPHTETPLPVAADPETASRAAGGIVLLTINGTSPVEARVVRVLPRFPTVGDRFVVADAGALADVLDLREPGTGAVQELWLTGKDPASLGQALRRAPFDQLRVDLRAEREDYLARDPLAIGASKLLRNGALIALAVAALALILLVVAERRDDAPELYAWESDGVSPGQLRVGLFARAAGVVLVATPGGVLIGVVLSRITSALVQVTALGERPRPPLAYAADPVTLIVTVLAGIGAGLAVAALIAAASLREPLPRRPEIA